MHVSILPTLQSTLRGQEGANGISLYHLERGEIAKESLELRLDIMDVYLNIRPQGWRLSPKHLHCIPFTTVTWRFEAMHESLGRLKLLRNVQK